MMLMPILHHYKLLLAAVLAGAASCARAEISYIIDSCDGEHQPPSSWWTSSEAPASQEEAPAISVDSQQSYIGAGSLRVAYNQEEEGDALPLEFGVRDERHYCRGATHLSLWYNDWGLLSSRQQSSASSSLQLDLVLLSDCDSSDSNCTEEETFTSELLSAVEDDDNAASHTPDGSWRELQWEWVGRSFSSWKIRLTSTGVTTPNNNDVLLLDHLACVGGGELLGAVFYANDDTDAWIDRYFESELAQELSTMTVNDNDSGALTLDYTVEQTESWGGFNDYVHLAPGSSYYNLSSAAALSLDYEVLEPSSVPEHAHLRIILMDGSDCFANCSEHPGQNLENYYSFHYILDGSDTNSTGTVSVRLEGSEDSSSALWRTGWTGIFGNNAFDAAHIKGYRLELNLDSSGGEGTLASGSVAFGNLTALNAIGAATSTDGSCVVEPDLLFRVDTSLFRRKEFLGSQCCRECDADPECLYAFSDSKDCYMASELGIDEVGLINSDFGLSTFTAFWSNNAAKRGGFCDRCECDEVNRVIDCRGRNLAIVPKTFSETSWSPRRLDLRDNPRLHLIGTGALEEIAESLEELRLPETMRHVSFETVRDLSALLVVRFEGDEQEGSGIDSAPTNHFVNNFIISPFDSFGDVCCNRGTRMGLSSPSMGLYFCDMAAHSPGIDAVYQPFELFIGATPLHKIMPRASFMGEAAKSVEYCAEYCAILSECTFFSYDGRWKTVEPTCVLLADNGTHTATECCKEDDYSIQGGGRENPGWTSGRPPRTRHLVDNAVVQVSGNDLIVNEANDFSSYFEVSLGSNPTRGAVWIEPRLSFPSQHVEVTVSPSRVALYGATMTARFAVAVPNMTTVSKAATVVATLEITSCDAAFTAGKPAQMAEAGTVFIDVVPTEEFNHISHGLKITGYVMFAIQGATCLCFSVWAIYYRDHSILTMSQPTFLFLVIVGCLVLSLSLLPTVVQAEYRYEPLTGEETEMSNKSVDRADAACMAFPWLFNIGFVIIFSALFAKIWRVRRIIRSSSSFRRTEVGAKNVAVIMVGFMTVMFILLLVWQLVDPLRWQREVKRTTDRGHPIESVGHCSSDSALAFIIPISVYDFGCLLYALYLCFVTRHHPDQINEGKWITISIVTILQILLLAIPVLIIAYDDTDAFFFVRAAVIFLISMGVMGFIFLPKLVHVHSKHPRGAASSSSRRSSFLQPDYSRSSWMHHSTPTESARRGPFKINESNNSSSKSLPDASSNTENSTKNLNSSCGTLLHDVTATNENQQMRDHQCVAENHQQDQHVMAANPSEIEAQGELVGNQSASTENDQEQHLAHVIVEIVAQDQGRKDSPFETSQLQV